MRLKSLLCLLPLLGVAHAQTWEKRIAPGLVYREEIDASVPRVVHILKWSLGTPVVHAGVDLAMGQVFDQTPLKGRETVSHMVERDHAVAGINGDFFHVPYSGDPLGLMVKDGELISVPIVPRSVLAWVNGAPQFGTADWKGEVTLPSGPPVPIDGLNESAEQNRVTLDTESAGYVLANAPNTAVVLKMDSGAWLPEGSRTGEVVEVVRDLASRKLQPGLAALVATGAKASLLAGLTVGNKIQIANHTTGFAWSDVKFAIGGGPALLKDGKLDVDWKAERFKDSFSLERHPRSAIGLTAAGDLCLVAVDGRESKVSEGATLSELAEIMQRLGCRDAMNLDGGGSTCLDIQGIAVNRPSDGAERAVGNALLLFQEDLREATGLPAPPKPDLSIKAPPKVVLGTDASLKVLDGGSATRNAEVLWSAMGSAWIDQGGMLHPIRTGVCRVTASSHGGRVTQEIKILAKPAPKKVRAPSNPRSRARRTGPPSRKKKHTLRP